MFLQNETQNSLNKLFVETVLLAFMMSCDIVTKVDIK